MMSWEAFAWPDAAVAIGCGLLLARALGLCLTAPGLAVPGLGWRFRLGLAASLVVVLAPLMREKPLATGGWFSVAGTALLEAAAGALLGWTVGLIVAGARLAGDLVAAQAGLSTAAVLGPENGEAGTALGQFHAWIATVLFVAMDGPLALVEALAESYTAIPMGELLVSREFATRAFAQVGQALELALRAAAPVAVALIMAGLVLGWLSRSAPALPLLALSPALRACLGVAIVLVGLAALAATFARAWYGVLPAL